MLNRAQDLQRLRSLQSLVREGWEQNGQDGGQGISARPHGELRSVDWSSEFVLLEARGLTFYGFHQSVIGCR